MPRSARDSAPVGCGMERRLRGSPIWAAPPTRSGTVRSGSRHTALKWRLRQFRRRFLTYIPASVSFGSGLEFPYAPGISGSMRIAAAKLRLEAWRRLPFCWRALSSRFHPAGTGASVRSEFVGAWTGERSCGNARRKVMRVSSEGRPSLKAKPGHNAVPLLT